MSVSRFSRSFVVAVSICVATVFAWLAGSTVTRAQSSPVLSGTVLEVIDGDSLVVRLDSGPVEVRMHAADAPEYDQPGGRAAQAALRQRLPRGAVVTLEPVEQDRYSRLVAIVRQDGQTLDQWIVRQGHAWAYRHYTSDVAYCEFEDEARRGQRGVWALPATQRIAPWDWRARKRDAAHPVHDYSGETLERCLAALRPVAKPVTMAKKPPRDLPHATSSVESGGTSTGACRIKGNIGSSGRRVYHVPGAASYESTRINLSRGERWFCSAEEAERAGWHPSGE
jgi:micrococcal nuclease